MAFRGFRRAVSTCLVILFTAAPLVVAGQTYQERNSDDYLCNHGDSSDWRTGAACARLRALTPAAQDEDTASQTPDSETSPAPPSPGPSDFQRGAADRMQYEAWYHGLSGDFLRGAAYWAANRSMSQHTPCTGANGMSAAWVGGCQAAAQRLAVADHLRLSSPDYRRGWNSIPSDPIDASQVTAPTTATPTPVPAQTTPSPFDQSPATANAVPPAASPSDSARANFNSAGAALALVGLVIALGALAVYLLPTLIAAGRKKRNTLAIFALNLLLGWTFLGWVGALVWSLSVDVQPASSSAP